MVSRSKLISTNAHSYLDAIAFYGIVLVLLLSYAFTSLESIWQRSAIAALIAVFGIVRAISLSVGGSIRRRTIVYLLPLAGIFLIGMLQAGILPGIPALSKDPYNTLVFLVYFGALVIAFEILSSGAGSKRREFVLLSVLFLIACATALYGFARLLAPDSFGVTPEDYQSFAQFSNRNHFALAMEMPAGLLAGILIFGRQKAAWRLLGLVPFAILCYAVVTSSSRGGLAALAASLVFVVFVRLITAIRPQRDTGAVGVRIGKRPRNRIGKLAVSIAASLLAGIFIWAAIGFIGGDYVVTRFSQVNEELTDPESTRVNRNVIWSATVDLISDRPLLGSGFGAYGESITRFSRSNGKFQIEQAHNDYLELLAGGGLLGFLFVAAFGALISSRIANNIRKSEGNDRAVLVGSAAGILAVLIHSFVDFGLHVLVNALAFAALIAMATAGREDRRSYSD
ncbi:MAG: hypothetical protein DWQ47_03490 [Acidobacteria bacterium]|nr:MAG: hypothetical protein DWQ32_07040 [Acidobacteriota bacterium]REK01464.1 MAG: hypothetical protein DWQ38_03475 [Acidobacteriota bacterium]REK14420.1 MAG: hypothetical protein DWQ43_12730 [Acidobacteriota bacterium]REK45135.1 MAG: hypothetical protein DWQ47_03490 [Acidobacteriota bacterium]